MNFAGLRPIGFAVLLVLLAGAGCNRPKRASSESSTPPTPQEVRTSVTMQAPDAFYDPPPDVPRKPGALLRSEPLKDVTLPAGVRGWRILYATTVDDNTPATAVATVFAPTDSSASSASCHRMGARHDGSLAEMHAVASVGGEQGHLRAQPDRDGWLGRGRDRLLLRRKGWSASLPDRRRRSACGTRFGPCCAADIRAYARPAHGSVGLLARGTRSALDRHCRAALRAGARNPRRRGNRTGRKH